MKHQQIQLVNKRSFIRIMALVAMLAVMVCGMILAVNAAGAENEPKQLTWASNASVSVPYNGDKYENVAVTLPALNGVADGDQVSASGTVSFPASTLGTISVAIDVELTGADKDKYTVAPLIVEITVTPIEITSITWEGVKSFTYGDDLSGIKAVGSYNGGTVDMVITNLAEAVNAGNYTLTAAVPNELYAVKEGVTATQSITIAKKNYNVVLNGREFLDNGELITSGVVNNYQLVVEGASEKLPAEVLSAIVYTYNGAMTPPTKPGTYTVKATLPTSDNYSFSATTLEATMNVVRNYKVVEIDNGLIVIVGENGISNSVLVDLNVPTEFDSKAVRGLKAYKGYSINITGTKAGEKFSIYIPVAADIIAKKHSKLLSVENLYICNGSSRTLAKETYTVSISEDRSYYIIEGYVPAGEVTFMLAPDFDTPFWCSAIGIALIIFVVLILLVVLPIYLGMKALRTEKSGRNPVISVETKGNAPDVEPVIIPDIIDDPDAIIEDGLNDLANTLAAEVTPEEAMYDADVTDAVAEAMGDLDAEIAEIELDNADGALDAMADQLALDLADKYDADNADGRSDELQQAIDEAMAENFNESADATDAIALVEDEDVVEEEPVVEEVVEEEPVVEEVVEEEPVVEEVVEEVIEEQPVAEDIEEKSIVEETVEESAGEEVVETVAGEPGTDLAFETEETEEEDESFGGFGSMPLDYIDAIVEAERYAQMLEQESRGEVQLVTRYRRSYLSRLAQSQGSIQDYYNTIKNLMLSYKGVKSRISWNFESFNVGRTPLAKFNAKTRTLYIYIALSPEELADTKYNFSDMSEKKKYAAVPVLIKVKGERKYKHAIELLTKLCEEKLQLPKKKNYQEVDYRMPFKTTEELVNEGIIKMMVAAIPVAAPAAEEAVVEEAPAEQEIVEKAIIEEAPAEEEIVEEAAIEEAPAEEEIAEEAIIEKAPVEEEIVEEAAIEEAPAEEEIAEEAIIEKAPVEEEIAEEAVEENDQNA